MPVHDATVTAVHWIESSTLKYHKLDVNVPYHSLVTGATDGVAAVWHIVKRRASWCIELCQCLSVMPFPMKPFVPKAAAPDISRRAAAADAGPITGLASRQAGDKIFLAVVSGTSPIQIWIEERGGEAEEHTWQHAQGVSAPQGIVQLCAAFGAITGHPDWWVSRLNCTLNWARPEYHE
jgi:hypothetical protein